MWENFNSIESLLLLAKIFHLITLDIEKKMWETVKNLKIHFHHGDVLCVSKNIKKVCLTLDRNDKNLLAPPMQTRFNTQATFYPKKKPLSNIFWEISFKLLRLHTIFPETTFSSYFRFFHSFLNLPHKYLIRQWHFCVFSLYTNIQ